MASGSSSSARQPQPLAIITEAQEGYPKPSQAARRRKQRANAAMAMNEDPDHVEHQRLNQLEAAAAANASAASAAGAAELQAAQMRQAQQAALDARMRSRLLDLETSAAASSSTAREHEIEQDSLRSHQRGKTTKAAAKHYKRVKDMERMLADTRTEATTDATASIARKNRSQYLAALALSSATRPGPQALQELRYWFTLKMDLATLGALQDRIIALESQQENAKQRAAQRLSQMHGSIRGSMDDQEQRQSRVWDAVIEILKVQADQRAAHLEEAAAEQLQARTRQPAELPPATEMAEPAASSTSRR
jgi:hypothetical protein